MLWDQQHIYLSRNSWFKFSKSAIISLSWRKKLHEITRSLGQTLAAASAKSLMLRGLKWIETCARSHHATAVYFLWKFLMPSLIVPFSYLQSSAEELQHTVLNFTFCDGPPWNSSTSFTLTVGPRWTTRHRGFHGYTQPDKRELASGFSVTSLSDSWTLTGEKVTHSSVHNILRQHSAWKAWLLAQ